MMCYGENNEINFDILPDNEIIGIFADNSFGKSSLLDIITYGIYGNTIRNEN
jgi:DNA repair exonuclease SbcCD ATPase subunit